jgi:biotin carboxyl carrier protein
MTPVLTPERAETDPGHPLAATVAADLRLAVAPSTGRFQPRQGVDLRAGVERGVVLGYVTGGRGRADEVRSPVHGTVHGMLVRPGQLVTRGQQLIWLETSA